ncbi:protein of unassigned function [Methylobacterium oryzae CBMB20]|uniref:Protein of unassigned function n=1 Tax=Methylobacterium oryzae CBMB20 TaxID=693986 RepID=A0A089P1T1_9HYPH|nr:protein of unassigned function [Methylobacterium oryzae CBMB20]
MIRVTGRMSGSGGFPPVSFGGSAAQNETSAQFTIQTRYKSLGMRMPGSRPSSDTSGC